MTTTASPPPASIDVEDVVRRFGDLPTLAPVAVEVLRLAEDERAGLDDIAEVISRDPGLAGQLLRLANSSLYSMGREVTSLTRAATVLGLRTVKLLSLSFSLVTSLGSGGDDVAVWRRSLAGSAMARTIASVKDPQIADECFVAGLLGHVGKLALVADPTYHEVLEAQGGWIDAAAEPELLGLTSDHVTRLVLEGWDLPPLFGQAIESRIDPDTVDGPAQRIARVLHVADAAAWLITADEATEPAALEACQAGAKRHLGLEEQELDEILVEAGPAIAEIAEMFAMDGLSDTPVTDLLLRARENLARVSLDVVAALSEEQQRASHLETENERLTNEAATDPLTGLPNRRSFDGYVENQVAGRIRNDRPGSLGMVMMDIDKFKSVNDTFGHGVGDDVLKGLAERLKQITRKGEMVARLGGEEFALVLPTTSSDEIAIAGERFRAAIAEEPFDTAIGPLEVTISVGTACAERATEDTAAHLYKAADEALYAAKEGGRNRVVAADPV